MTMIQTAILGATGYTGAELIRLLDQHPVFQIAHLGANSQAGRVLHQVLPNINTPLANTVLQAADAPLDDNIALVFTALPHTAAAPTVAKALAAGKKVVDLSADFRHQSAATYADAYGVTHTHPKLLAQSVYGLSEWHHDAIAASDLVANPGCYPTSVLLPLLPLLQAGVLHTEHALVVDAKSGASGAGRLATTALLYCEVNESIRAYGLPRHRHAWEMEEWAKGIGGVDTRIRFVPHLLPMGRGMLSTLHLSGVKGDDWWRILTDRYADCPFVRVLPQGVLPAVKGVQGSNRCDIGVAVLGKNRQGYDDVVIVSCIDNLLKGASGQAVQNANIMFGLDPTTALPMHAQWP